jgi:hypothetical protein
LDGRVSFKKIFGQIANVEIRDRKTIGSIPMVQAKSTIIGAIKTPKRLIASIMPHAVD